MKRELKLKNRKFELTSRFGEESIHIAECAWSQFKGPLYRRHWFSKTFEIFCWCARKAVDPDFRT